MPETVTRDGKDLASIQLAVPRGALEVRDHEWTRCPRCPNGPGEPCACSGVPCCDDDLVSGWRIWVRGLPVRAGQAITIHENGEVTISGS